MTAQDWRDLARMYRAGAACHASPLRGLAEHRLAEALNAQADKCEAIARERESQEGESS